MFSYTIHAFSDLVVELAKKKRNLRNQLLHKVSKYDQVNNDYTLLDTKHRSLITQNELDTYEKTVLADQIRIKNKSLRNKKLKIRNQNELIRKSDIDLRKYEEAESIRIKKLTCVCGYEATSQQGKAAHQRKCNTYKNSLK